jgi:uncharacterized membrane protein YfcA
MLEVIIIILSIIQSVFGIGLLIIGTPLLLILNYDFFNSLNILLPCSILISILQISNSRFIKKTNTKIIFSSLPLIAFGIFIIFYYKLYINFKIFIGFAILCILGIKFILNKDLTSHIIKKNKKITFMFIGLFHGLTNAGGSLMSLYFQELIKKNKIKLQSYIAFSYFFFATTQYLFLNIFSNKIIFNATNIELLMLSVASYMIGKKIFLNLNLRKYLTILNFIIFLSSVSLILSGLGLI